MPDKEEYVAKPFKTTGTPTLDSFVEKDVYLSQQEVDAAVKELSKVVRHSDTFKKIAEPSIKLFRVFLRRFLTGGIG